MLNEENPDLFKWLTGQEAPSQQMLNNMSFQVIVQIDLHHGSLEITASSTVRLQSTVVFMPCTVDENRRSATAGENGAVICNDPRQALAARMGRLEEGARGFGIEDR